MLITTHWFHALPERTRTSTPHLTTVPAPTLILSLHLDTLPVPTIIPTLQLPNLPSATLFLTHYMPTVPLLPSAILFGCLLYHVLALSLPFSCLRSLPFVDSSLFFSCIVLSPCTYTHPNSSVASSSRSYPHLHSSMAYCLGLISSSLFFIWVLSPLLPLPYSSVADSSHSYPYPYY